MPKSATELMHDILFNAVIDAIQALKTASKGLPNTLLRDLNAIHANVTLADLPPDVQTAIAANVRTAFGKLLKEGYSVTSSSGIPERRAPPPAPTVGRGERRAAPPPPRGPKPGSPGGRPGARRPPPKPRG